jgi:Ca-activated chloride channel family protein
MRFGNFDYLYLLIPVVVTAIAFFFLYKHNEKFFKRYEITSLRKISPLDKRFFRSFFLFLSLVSIVVSLSSPRFGVALEKGERRGRDIYLLIDVSASMNAQDLKPSRLEVTKQAVYDFLSLLNQDRIGVIVFAGDAFVLCPLTTDYDAVTMFVESIDSDMTSAYGTDLGQALEVADKSFPKESQGFKTVVVFTDGEDFGRNAETAIEKCVNEGVVMYAVGVGSDKGAPIPVYDEEGNVISYKKDNKGETVITKLNAKVLKRLAAKGSGEFILVNNNLAIKSLASTINSLSKKKMETKGFVKLKDRYYIPLGIGVLCLIIFLILL